MAERRRVERERIAAAERERQQAERERRAEGQRLADERRRQWHRAEEERLACAASPDQERAAAEGERQRVEREERLTRVVGPDQEGASVRVVRPRAAPLLLLTFALLSAAIEPGGSRK
jgi:hypothetical protein